MTGNGSAARRRMSLRAGFAAIVAGFAAIALAASAQAAPGDLDTSWGGGSSGWAIVHMTDGYDLANAATLDSSGGVVMAGETRVSGTERDVGVARLLPNGLLDEDFAGGRYLADPSPDTRDFVDSVIELDNGNFLVGGTFTGSESSWSAGLLALDPSGQPVSGFGDSGFVIQDYGRENRSGGAFASGGKLYWYGREDVPGLGNPSDFQLVRFEQDGTLDSSFGGGTGRVTYDFHSYSEQYHVVVPLPDGRFLIGGEAGRSMDWRIVLLNPDGSLDTGFGSGGSTTVSFNTPNTNNNDFLYGLAVQPDGKIVGVGGAGGHDYISVARMHSDGSLDTSFAGNGKRLISPGEVNTARDVEIQKDGKIALAGYTGPENERDFLAMRLNPNGSTDTSFGNGGMVTLDVDDAGYWNVAKALVMEPDGDMILVGYGFRGSSVEFAAAKLEGDSGPAPTGDLGDLGGGGGSATPGPGPGPGTVGGDHWVDIRVFTNRFLLGRRAMSPVPHRCLPSEMSPPCVGLTRVFTRLRLGSGQARWILLAGGRFRLGAGQRARVPMRTLPRRVRYVHRLGRRRSAVAITLVRDAAGNRRRLQMSAPLIPR